MPKRPCHYFSADTAVAFKYPCLFLSPVVDTVGEDCSSSARQHGRSPLRKSGEYMSYVMKYVISVEYFLTSQNSFTETGQKCLELPASPMNFVTIVGKVWILRVLVYLYGFECFEIDFFHQNDLFPQLVPPLCAILFNTPYFTRVFTVNFFWGRVGVVWARSIPVQIAIYFHSIGFLLAIW